MKDSIYTAIIILGALFCSLTVGAKQKQVEVKHVHPEFWWSGMKNSQLQVLVHGDQLGAYDVTLEGATDVELTKVIKPENKNYVILYLGLEKAQPQTFSIVLKNGKKAVKKISYELMQRDGRMPSYDYLSMEGPPHAPVFAYRVMDGEQELGRGSGTSKQNAQQAAARDALKRMGA